MGSFDSTKLANFTLGSVGQKKYFEIKNVNKYIIIF